MAEYDKPFSMIGTYHDHYAMYVEKAAIDDAIAQLRKAEELCNRLKAAGLSYDIWFQRADHIINRLQKGIADADLVREHRAWRGEDAKTENFTLREREAELKREGAEAAGCWCTHRP